MQRLVHRVPGFEADREHRLVVVVGDGSALGRFRPGNRRHIPVAVDGGVVQVRENLGMSLFDDFDGHFNQIRRLMIVGIIGTWVVGLVVLVAVGYAAYKVLVHFGIL